MPTLINVCGAGRSGSTMIHLMLGNAPDAFSCGEAYAWFRPWRTHHFRIDCSCDQDACPYWEKIKHYPESAFHKQVSEQLGVNYVVDCSKDLCWIIDNNHWAARNRMRVVNLLVWKDPIDLVYSLWKRERIDTWPDGFVTYYARFFQVGLPFCSISYNQLVQYPAEKLEDICNVVGMEYFEGKERFWEKQHHFLFGSAGVREQVARGTSEIRSSRDFPPGFLRERDRFAERIEGNAQIQGILRRLKVSEVSLPKDRDYDADGLPKRPLWYYQHRLKRILVLRHKLW